MFPNERFVIRELSGPWLDFAVANAEIRSGIAVSKPIYMLATTHPEIDRDWYSPSMKANDCWPIIERVRPLMCPPTVPEGNANERAQAIIGAGQDKSLVIACGPTYLIAFCRAYAESVLGPEVHW